MNAAELLIECLEAEGVEHIFGLPGEELKDVMLAMRESDIEFVPVRHEQGAAFMADVHGRLTGEAGVCLSTLGPGATNLITGVADAHLDKSPLVAITGQGSREKLHKESHQMLDIIHIFEATVKWNTQLDDVDIINESVRKAFKLAEWEKPGATHLEFPEDVAAEEIDAEPLPVRDPVRRPDPDSQSIERAASLLSESEQPIVLAGNGAVRTNASDRLRTFVDQTDIPVIATFMGKGAISDRDEQSLMTLGSGPNGEATEAVQQADLVLAVGYDIAEHDPESWNPEGDKTIIHLDHEPAEVYEHYNPDVEVVADITMSIQQLSETVAESWSTWCSDAHDTILDAVMTKPDAGEEFSVEGTLPYLREAMADDDVLLSDVGSHKMEIARNLPVYEPNTCIISNGLATMGISVPGAVAADLAIDGNVVACTGDGGFLMNAAELNTADRLDLDFTVVLFNDDEFRLIREEFEEERGDHFGTDLTNPDFVTFTESFGMDAYRPESWAELEDAIDACVGSDGLSLIEVRMEQ